MANRGYAGTTEIGFALLRRTTDNRQQTTEGEAGSKLKAHNSLPKKYYNITTTLHF